MILLKAQGLKKYYGKEEAVVKALDGVDLEVEKGEFIAVMGRSGSGKSTLLNLLGGLDSATEGTVEVDGVEIASLSDEELAVFRRRKVGFIFQNYNLVPILNAYENIVFPLELDNSRIDEEYIDTVIQMLHLEEKLAEYPEKLSGGQQQRISIARALALKPSIVLADEPTGNLDSKSSREVLSLLKMTSQLFGQTIIMITHDEEIAQMADRIVYIQDGRIAAGEGE